MSRVLRRNRNAVVNIVIFFFSLLLILYLSVPQGQSAHHYAWDKIRYESVNPTPPSRGLCPGISSDLAKPVLIVARTLSETISAFDDILDKYHVCPYTADAQLNPGSIYLQTPANRGHEAMAYLTFIIDNYSDLPSTGMVFVHGSRFAWHNDDPVYDNVSLLKQLNITRALWGPPGPATGYWNMKCDWSAGMCDAKSDEGKPQGSMETRIRAMLEPQNKRAVSDVALTVALKSIFGGPILAASTESQRKALETKLDVALSRSDAIRSQCCAQFIVARENIWSHTRDEYIALRQWLLDGIDTKTASPHDLRIQQPNNHITQSTHHRASNPPAPSDDLIAGRILSYMWHILFLPAHSAHPQPGTSRGVDLNRLNNLACPSADLCYCRLYNRCNLSGCDKPHRCRGQYRRPRGYKLPPGWAEEHS